LQQVWILMVKLKDWEKDGKWLPKKKQIILIYPFIYLVGACKRRKIPPSNRFDYFPLVVQFVCLLPPKQAKTTCHVTLKKGDTFHC